jgi:hypothetical protein
VAADDRGCDGRGEIVGGLTASGVDAASGLRAMEGSLDLVPDAPPWRAVETACGRVVRGHRRRVWRREERRAAMADTGGIGRELGRRRSDAATLLVLPALGNQRGWRKLERTPGGMATRGAVAAVTTLVKTVARALRWRRMLANGRVAASKELAALNPAFALHSRIPY